MSQGIKLTFKIDISSELLKDLMKFASLHKEEVKEEEKKEKEKEEKKEKEEEVKKEGTTVSYSVDEALPSLFNFFAKVCAGETVTQEDTFKVLNSIANVAKPTQTNTSNVDDKWLKDLAKQVINHEPPYTG